MRAPITYSEVRLIEPEAAIASLTRRLAGLPPPGGVGSRERALAAWLSPQQARRIQDNTRDPLSDFLAGETRSLSTFLDRRPLDPVGRTLCAHAAAPMTIERLQRIAGGCVGRKSQPIRAKGHRTTADKDGRSVDFIPPEEVKPALERICAHWNGMLAQTGEAAVASAVWILVAVLNAHAFPNGNGRLARALFSGALARTGACRHGYIPLGPLIYATQGNFEVGVRRAELQDDWSTLARMLDQMIADYAELLPAFEQRLAATTYRGNDVS